MEQKPIWFDLRVSGCGYHVGHRIINLDAIAILYPEDSRIGLLDGQQISLEKADFDYIARTVREHSQVISL